MHRRSLDTGAASSPVPDHGRDESTGGALGGRRSWRRSPPLTPSAGISTLLSNTRSSAPTEPKERLVLTARQQEIWNFLVEYVDKHGYPPTVREVGEHVGLASPSTVHAHLANLERAGLLRRDPTKPRALELIGRERREAQPAAAGAAERPDVSRLPLVGEIAAGGPLLAEQNIEDYLPMPASVRGDFLLRVKGDSMIDAGILDGDLVIVQRAQDARNGEIVVALAGEDESVDEATVKTFYREADRIRLQPENASLEPIFARHVQILGRVVGVFREL
jgi:repressor LexA